MGEQLLRLTSIELRNYRVFRHAVLEDLPSVVLLLGSNGSGKSTLLDALRFMQEAIREGLPTAVAARGGFQELRSRSQDGPIGIALTFAGKDGAPLRYSIEFNATKEGGVFVCKEVLAKHPKQGPPELIMDFGDRLGFSVTNGSGRTPARQEHELANPADLALQALGMFREYPALVVLRAAINAWFLTRFDFTDARHGKPFPLSPLRLIPSGQNLAGVVFELKKRHPEVFADLLEKLKQRVPLVDGVETRPMAEDRVLLEFHDASSGEAFNAHAVSDGTIKLFTYLVLLHDPWVHPLISLEEPETQLHPQLLPEIIEDFRGYARRGSQVFVSTHSPDLVNAANLTEIYWLVKEQGFSRTRRASDVELLRNMVREGDLPGALWKRGLFEGAGPR